MFVDDAVRPLAIVTPQPRFGWRVPLEGRGRAQSAYRILVATDPGKIEDDQPDLWDSGRVESSQSMHVPYDGERLASNMDCYWSVQLWDEAGNAIDSDRIEPFGTPLFDQADWQAQWIGMGDPNEPFPDTATFQRGGMDPAVEAFEPDQHAPMLAREFELTQPVKRARAFVCGLGLYELRLNGAKVGNDVLPTPRTDFRQRAIFNTYDITDQLNVGANAIGLMLGNGWFNGQKRFWGWQQQWHGSPRAIVQVEIELADGSTQRIVSDDQWQGDWSPITANCIYDGETYDARLEQIGWDMPSFDRSSWVNANIVPSPGGKLAPMSCDAQQVTQIVRPVGITEPQPGVYVFDMGRNMTGWVRLKVAVAAAGANVRLRFGEAMHADGSLNNSSNNAAKQTDQYICKGDLTEQWEPRFTFHGFQFVEVTGLPHAADFDTLEGRFVRTAVAQHGHFACGNDLINNIHRCTAQSLLCNVQMGVPTDDTQRPERLGWGADAWACANASHYNMSMARLYRKWIDDHVDGQTDSGFVGMIVPQSGPEEDLVWTAAFVLIPWWQYVHCGDRRILEDNYPALQRYMAFLERCGTNRVEPIGSMQGHTQVLWTKSEDERFPSDADRGHLQVSQWGDHLATADGHRARANMPLSIATAFYYLDATTMAKTARALGLEEDAARYSDLASRINAAFHERFFDPVMGYYDAGTQSAQAWPLAFGMVSDDQRENIERALIGDISSRQRRLTTGYASTRFAIEALAQADRHDVIWELATKTDFPSWGYMLSHGRTTSCERWDGEGGSLNHAPLGAAIDEWFYNGLAGIQPDPAAPGYANIIFKPYLPADLDWAQASINTTRGPIKSSWRKHGHHATLDIEVPANSTATVHLPAGDPSKITEQDTPVAQSDDVTVVDSTDDVTTLTVGSGCYRFTFPRTCSAT